MDMKLQIKSKIPIIYLIFAFLLLLYVFYQNIVLGKGSDTNYYYKYYILIIITFFSSIVLLFLNKNINVKILTIFISSLFTLYLIEFFLIFYEKNPKIFIGKNYDDRSRIQVVDDLRKKDKKATLSIFPSVFLSNDKIIPVSGLPGRQTVLCNENGYFAIYESDRYGFNNIDSNWDNSQIDVLLIGDSHTHGSCVNYKDTIAGNLNKINSSLNVINAGMKANGPLIELASLREIINLNKKIDNVILILTSNDIDNLVAEKKNKILINYLNDEDFSQNLFSKQKIVDNLMIDFLVKEEKKRRKEDKYFDFKRHLKLTKLRMETIEVLFPTSSKVISLINPDDVELFLQIIDNFVLLSKKHQFSLDIFYMPGVTEFTEIKNQLYPSQINRNKSFEIIFEYIRKNNIGFYDLRDLLFKQKDDPLYYFNFMASRYDKRILNKRYGHLNEKGYEELSKIIYGVIEKLR